MYRNLCVFIVLCLALVMRSSAQVQVDEAVDSASGQTGAYPMCGSQLLEPAEKVLTEYVAAHPEAAKRLAKTTSWNFTVGSTHEWYAYDYTTVTDYKTNSTCRAVGKHCYIFVEDSMWTTGRVDQDIVDSVRVAFDDRVPANPSKGVYQMDVDAFGDPPDVDGDSLIIILLLNIRDGYSGSGGYVAGYYYNKNEYNVDGSNVAEIYFLDANPLDLRTRRGLTVGMSTTAHEFQHMIHWNYHPSQMTFVNEGCSLVAEVNCGYGIYSQGYYNADPSRYLFDWQSGSFSSVLYDYSRAARFFTYLRDQFTMGFFKSVVQGSSEGVAGLSSALEETGTGRTFTSVFEDWTIANGLNDMTVDSRYGYVYPGLTAPTAKVAADPNVTIAGLKIPPLGTSYVTFSGGANLSVAISGAGGKLTAKALELGSSKRVADLSNGSTFLETGFGTTYNTITLVLTDTSSSDSVTVNLTATGATSTSAVQNSASTSASLYDLSQNYPNPFNPVTTIQFRTQNSELLTLKVYDAVGREVATLAEGRYPAGTHQVTFDGNRLSSGMYFYRLTSGSFISTKRMMLVR